MLRVAAPRVAPRAPPRRQSPPSLSVTSDLRGEAAPDPAGTAATGRQPGQAGRPAFLSPRVLSRRFERVRDIHNRVAGALREAHSTVVEIGREERSALRGNLSGTRDATSSDALSDDDVLLE